LNLVSSILNICTITTDSDVPVKIVICFVTTKARRGQTDLNPFEFNRRWEISSSRANRELREEFDRVDDLKNRFESRLESLDEKINALLQLANPQARDDLQGRSKDQGRSNVNPLPSAPPIETEEERLADFFSRPRQPFVFRGDESSTSEIEGPQAPQQLRNGKKYSYIQKIDCLLNGQLIGKIVLISSSYIFYIT
jgi:hypothetical protein